MQLQLQLVNRKTEFQCIQLNYTRTVGVGPSVKLFHGYLLIDYRMVHTFVIIRHNTHALKCIEEDNISQITNHVCLLIDG